MPTNAGYAQTTVVSVKGEGFVQPEFLGLSRKAAATRTRNRTLLVAIYLLALFPMRMLRVFTGLAAETDLEQGDAAPPAGGSSPWGGSHYGGRRADSRHLRRLSHRGPANRHPFYLAGYVCSFSFRKALQIQLGEKIGAL